MHCIDHPHPCDEIASLSIPSPALLQTILFHQLSIHQHIFTNSSSSRHQGDRGNNILSLASLSTTNDTDTFFRSRPLTVRQPPAKKNSQKENPQTSTSRSVVVRARDSSKKDGAQQKKDALVALEGGDSGPLERRV